ncbi:MAG: hypothetical protein JXO72_11490 [Vicinamibacteria bacterium]|nr:hypothetical protein [Vicinamibacteria bacterium]
MISGSYEGIEHAQLVLINDRSAAQRARGDRLLPDVHRIRSDRSVFDDVLGYRGTRIPITAVVADLADADDASTRKTLARVRRVLRVLA